MNRLSPSEVEEITTEIVRLRSVDSDTAENVLSEFQGLMTTGTASMGGVGAAQSILEASMGRDHASQILGRLAEASVSAPFAFLAEADPKLLLTFLADEHPQTIALVLAYMRTDQASAILSGLDPETQVAVAQRIGTMESAAPDQVRLVADVLRRRASSLLQPSSASARVGGVQPLVDIINRADPATERTILESLEKQDPALAEEIRSRLFVFDDITTLEDKGVQLVLRQVDTAVLAIALKGVSSTVQDKVLTTSPSGRATTSSRRSTSLGRSGFRPCRRPRPPSCRSSGRSSSRARSCCVGVVVTMSSSADVVVAFQPARLGLAAEAEDVRAAARASGYAAGWAEGRRAAAAEADAELLGSTAEDARLRAGHPGSRRRCGHGRGRGLDPSYDAGARRPGRPRRRRCARPGRGHHRPRAVGERPARDRPARAAPRPGAARARHSRASCG